MRLLKLAFFLTFILPFGLKAEVGTSTVVNQAPSKTLAFTADVTWASKYMLDGFKVAGDSPVWQLAFKTNLYATGFSVMLWGALQADREQKQYDEADFFVMYSKDFLEQSRYKINFHSFYDFWIFPNTEPIIDEFGDVVSTAKRRGNKFHVGVSMPQLIPLAQSFIIPSYNIYHWIYYDQDREDLDESGTRHELLAEYDQSIPVFIRGANYQYAGATANINYHTGVFGVEAGFSHSVASLRTGAYALKSIFEVSLNHQWTFEPTVNPGNVVWSTMSYIKKF